MQGRDFLTAVQHLAEHPDEPSLRSSISRSYYAAYLEARSFCEAVLGYTRTRSSAEHQDIPKLLDSIDKDLVVKLRFLRSRRNMADYDLDVSLATIAGNVPVAERFAAEIIAALDAHADALNSSEVDTPDATP